MNCVPLSSAQTNSSQVVATVVERGLPKEYMSFIQLSEIFALETSSEIPNFNPSDTITSLLWRLAFGWTFGHWIHEELPIGVDVIKLYEPRDLHSLSLWVQMISKGRS